ncbi:DUF2515 family protein [Cohnella sp. CFH 77786]|uniref:DUF2515 family protein n=1 Tax=Cohnella sp. CFH 77786 TaxID=2662265 RepID=UPI001C60DEB4
MTSIWEIAGALARGFVRKTTAWRRSSVLTAERAALAVPDKAVREIALLLENKLERSGAAGGRHAAGPPKKEQAELASRIRKETQAWNLNNVTRTQAYWNMYREYPELHWALLAHLVSRNGGWSMTDLKGEWLPRLLRPESAEVQFALLEACNALIFRDAYPQLKLYAESRIYGMPLFALLPSFGVSSFMAPFWERFWSTRESALLTVALIINEQHVIQGPVVERAFFRERVFESLSFRAIPYLQTNQIVFPLLSASRNAGRPIPLAGRVLENFPDLRERVEFGKSLYAMLFGYPRVLTEATAFAAKVPHTGSRSDYWPERFSAAKRKTGGTSPDRDFSAGIRWYSPPLEAAWPDRPLPESAPPDWFRDRSALAYLTPLKAPRIIDMTAEHLLGQHKWQAAVRLKQDVF